MKRALFVAVAASAVLAGCGGTSSVSDNRGEVCDTLASFDSWMRPSMGLTNPDGSMAQAQEALGNGAAQIEQVRPDMTGSQQDLLDRTSRAVNEYRYVATTKDPNTTLADNTLGLEPFQFNVLVNHRVMLNTVGCPLPDYLESFPTG